MRIETNSKTTTERTHRTKTPLLAGQGRDELNLAEFPFAILQYQSNEQVKTVRFSDTITGKDGRSVERKWTVTGGDAYGLPVAGDVDIVIALLVLTQEQGLKSREVLFTRYDLMRIMGLDNRGRNYGRIKDGLDRLTGVTIEAERAFYDKQKQAYLTRAFHIIDDYDLWDRAEGESDSEQDRLPLKSVVTWNRNIFKSLKSGYVKRLDAQRYFRLSTPIAKQLFRYLDKKFYRDRHFQIDIFKLCHEHLGISRACGHVSKLKERLATGLDELVRDGYLETYRFAKSATIRRSVNVQFVKTEAASQIAQSPTPATYFYEQLHHQAHISRPIASGERDHAEKFVSQHGLDVFREFVDFVMREKTRQWPNLATLTGAFNAFEDPFLTRLQDRQARQEEAQRQRREETATRQLREDYEAYFEPLIEHTKSLDPERYAAFEREVEGLPDYRRCLAKIVGYDKQAGPLSKAAREQAERERRELLNRRFVRRFQDQGAMDFETWKTRNDAAALNTHRQAA